MIRLSDPAREARLRNGYGFAWDCIDASEACGRVRPPNLRICRGTRRRLMYEVQSAVRGWLLETGELVIARGLDTWLRLEVKMALVLALACWRWRWTDTDG